MDGGLSDAWCFDYHSRRHAARSCHALSSWGEPDLHTIRRADATTCKEGCYDSSEKDWAIAYRQPG